MAPTCSCPPEHRSQPPCSCWACRQPPRRPHTLGAPHPQARLRATACGGDKGGHKCAKAADRGAGLPLRNEAFLSSAEDGLAVGGGIRITGGRHSTDGGCGRRPSRFGSGAPRGEWADCSPLPLTTGAASASALAHPQRNAGVRWCRGGGSARPTPSPTPPSARPLRPLFCSFIKGLLQQVAVPEPEGHDDAEEQRAAEADLVQDFTDVLQQTWVCALCAGPPVAGPMDPLPNPLPPPK